MRSVDSTLNVSTTLPHTSTASVPTTEPCTTIAVPVLVSIPDEVHVVPAPDRHVNTVTGGTGSNVTVSLGVLTTCFLSTRSASGPRPSPIVRYTPPATEA